MHVDVVSLNEIIDMDKGFTSINAKHGSIDEFKELVKLLKENGIKVVIDFVPNHTTEKCPWLVENANGNAAFKDYYIWSNTIPNNWVCF